MADKEDARTEFLQGAEEVLERANTDPEFGTTHSDEIRQITEWQAEMLDDPDAVDRDEFVLRVEVVEKLAAAR